LKRWLIDVAGVKITVMAKPGPAEDLVNVALSAMQTERDAKTQGIKLSVKYDDGAWELTDHSNNLERRLDQTGDLIYHLTDRIVFHVADKSEGAHCLHAAAVSKNGRAIVVPANSGAGKSTFTTWLAANDFDYLTDELILVDGAGNLEAIARPIQIKSHGLEAIDHLISDHTQVKKGKFANALPISSLAGAVAEGNQVLGLFVFPKYAKGAEFSMTKLTSAEAGMRLMANHVNARNLEGHGFRAMMELMRTTPSYALEYGGFDTLPKDMVMQLNERLASTD